MADTGVGALRRVVVCDNKCGCTVPCTGGSGCRCKSSASVTGGGDHMTCSCGEHCDCNPCSCAKNVATGNGCKCGTDCTCASCHT